MLEFKRPLVVVDIRYEDTDTEELVFKMFCQCPFLMLFISSVSNIFCHSILFSWTRNEGELMKFASLYWDKIYMIHIYNLEW